MVVLTCDICGGSLSMSAGSKITCDNCGMSYSKDRVQEKVQEIRGVVRVDNSHLVENYLNMAQNANESDNKSEAESYCNKIIEIDPQNYQAWFIKGKAAGWQSTIGNIRFVESVNCFHNSIQYAPEEKTEELKNESIEEIKRLSFALIGLRAERFVKYLDEEETNGFKNDINIIHQAVSQFFNKSGVLVWGVMEPIAEIINSAVVTAWRDRILTEYHGEEGRPNKYEWQTFINRAGYCTTLLEQAVELSDEDENHDITCYENLIHIHNEAIDSCSWDYNFTDGGYMLWEKEWVLTENAKKARLDLINQYKLKITEIENK